MVKEKETSKYIKQVIIEYCPIHIGKEIQFYCNSCSNLACGACLIDYHNGHNFGLLGDAIEKIKINICDADNILNELLYQNYNNQKLLYLILNEVNEYKKGQQSYVIKSIDEVVLKLNQIKNEIIKEFDKKYNLEFKRIERFKNNFEDDINEIQKTKLIIKEILKEFDISSDINILKQKKVYDNFLYWCDLNIKRIYKGQKRIVNEMSIDPSIKPFPINISELINLLNYIDPKNIVYPLLNNNNSINKNNDLTIDNNINKNNNYNISEIKNSRSYSYNIKNHNINDYNISNNYIKKNKSGDIIQHHKIPIDNYEEYINQHEYTRTNNNNNYYDKYQKEISQYKEPNQNNIFPQNKNNEIISKSNSEFFGNQSKSNPPKSQIPFYQNIIISEKEKEKINNFYNNMKMNNEMAIYCFTNLNSCLIYHILSQKWINIPFQNEILKELSYSKKSSLSLIPEEKLIIGGGYNTKTKEITNTIIQMNIYDIEDIKILNPMKIKRYSHSFIYLSNYIYCIGGYGYKNDKTIPSSSQIISLKSCEKYDIKNKEWKEIKELNSARACFGKCIYNSNIFVFGGYDNNNILSSIEKYEPITDIWITYYIKLPIKIAELGVINYNNKYIFLLGGIDENKNLLDNVYIGRLDQNFVNYSWKEGPKLMCPRNTGTNCFYLNNYIYVLGGSNEGICEKYSLIKKKWEMINSYLMVMNDLGDDKIKYMSSELIYNFSFT